ncbi:MAG: tRNA pseudouridine(38-40) synthase TruA [Dysgonamonadaceae bacterium]|jgi:tRNA pseudouridine38-40 synthase|nr:tRNA pseudouridine(38-40) synthase TruA [Dysgonamonadaceae bacterium]
MRRYFIYLSYAGTAYCGWQNQPNGVTVQQRLEEALSLLLREKIDVVGAGRTDAGVHARLMVAHFDYGGGEVLGDLVGKLNGILPCDISVDRIVEVDSGSHARFDAVSRTYQYFICLRKDSFYHPFHLRTRYDLDFVEMNRAAALLLDYTDFGSFCKAHSDNRTNRCHITEAVWAPAGVAGEWVFTIRADRFLRNMVRAIVGTLLDVGRGKITVEDFRMIIESGDRSLAGASAPACGLFLAGIEY